MRRPLFLTGLLLLGGLAGFLGGGLWLASSESGLQTVAGLATAASGGGLQIGEPSGRLLGPLHIRILRWAGAGLRLEIDNLRLDWSPSELLQGRLAIGELAAERLHIELRPSPPQPPPTELALPLAVEINRFAVDRLEYRGLPVVHDLAGQLSSDGGQYRLRRFHAGLGDVSFAGEATLGATAPLQLAATAEITGQLERHPLALSLNAAGPLAEIALQVTAHAGLQGEARVALTPFAGAPFASAHIALDDIDPAAWQATAPQARLRLQADLTPQGRGVAGRFALSNAQPGPLDRHRLPLTRLEGKVDWPGETASFADLRATLAGAGELVGSARWQQQSLDLDLVARRVDAAQIVTALRPTRLSGPLTARLGADRQTLNVDLKDATFSLAAEASHVDGVIAVPRLALGAGDARLSGQGELRVKDMGFRAAGEVQRFDPARFASRLAALPAALINASFKASGRLRAHPVVDASFTLTDSRLAGQPLTGRGQLSVDWPNIPRAELELVAGPNRLASHGAFGRPGDTLTVDIETPQLDPYGLQGGLSGHLDLGGNARQPRFSGRLQAEQLGSPGLFHLAGLRLSADAAGEAAAPLHVDLAIASLATPEQPALIKGLQVRGEGSNQAHRLQASADLAGRNHLQLAADGGLIRENGEWLWRGQLQEASLQAADPARNFRLLAPSLLQLAGSSWRLGPARLAGEPLDWQATLHAEAEAGRLQASLSGRGSRLGHIEAELQAGLQGAWSLADQAPWKGRLQTEIADLGWLGEVIGEQWQSAGRLTGEIRLAGTPALPRTSGRLRGERLALRLPGQGLNLAHGELDIALDDNLLRVTKLGFDSLHQALPRPLRLADKALAARLDGAAGRFEVSGEMRLDGSPGAGRAWLDVHLDRLGAWQLPDQWVAVSGDGRLTWQDGTLGLRGKLAVDAGYWQLARSGTPQLSDDVVIKRPASEKTAGLRPRLDLDIVSDLGEHFLFNGAGLSARLAGDIRLRASGRDLPRASGNIRAEDGHFDAYGQQLAIERGILSFQGLLDNPALDVRAVRRGLAVEPGVQIGGTAKKPIIRLISDPDLPDAEKLAWLVLGHGPEQMGAGDATVLLSAAGGLLGNDSGGLVQQLKKNFGVDELGVRSGQIGDLGVRQPGSRVAGSGVETTDSTSHQIFSVGKRLSSTTLLSYEQALGKAESIVKLTVSLGRRLSLVGRAGSDNALDLFYTLSFGSPPDAGKR
ncbi:MAG: translocation/assembly module TamB domain-containing protein [Bacteroidota bacterium]